MTVTKVEYCTVMKKVEELKEEETLKEKIPPTEEKPFKRKIVWFNAIGFLVLHIAGVLGLIYGLVCGKFLSILWTFFLAMITGESITAGAHRLWSHKAYKATLPLKIALLIGQTMAGQNCLWVLVRDHRQHHKFSDTDADPHNAQNGFFFSHVGWLMTKKHPEVIRKGKMIDMSDIEADPWIMFQKRHYKILYIIFAILIPVMVPVYFWNEDFFISFMGCYIARFVVTVNATWLVNSYAHLYGTKPYTKDILPVETAFVAICALGEGWHNYHHTFPWDYRASEYGHSINLTTTVLDFLAKYGLVYDRRFATEDMVRHRVLKQGDGTHPKYGHYEEEPEPVT